MNRPFAKLQALLIFAAAAACASGGELVQWGDSIYAQRNGFPTNNTGFVQVAAGGYHNVALKADGSIVQWGDNGLDQRHFFPTNNTGFVQVAAGGYHNVALKADGSIVQWGNNGFGQRIGFPTNNTGFVQVAAGWSHNVALKADGSIVQWGNIELNQRSGFPTNNTGFVQVAAGSWHCVALKADGSIVQWGDNTQGQRYGFPTSNTGFVQVAAGGYHNVALKADGSIVQWGYSGYNQRSGFPTNNVGFVQVVAGGYDCVALKADGSLVQWGGSGYNQRSGFPTNNTGFVKVAAGWTHSVALRKPTRAWTVIRLHPAGAIESSANAVDQGMQGGYADYGTGHRATMWTGSDQSAVDLDGDTGLDWFDSMVTAIDGGKQYGIFYAFADPYRVGQLGNGVEWGGTPGPLRIFTENQSMNNASKVFDAKNGQQVGEFYDNDGGMPYASLWSGAADSPTQIGGANTRAFGVGGGLQVGCYGWWAGGLRARMWSGSMSSQVDLHPSSAAWSWASGTDGIQQVGSAEFIGVEQAVLWSGSSAYVSLHPAGATASVALKVSNGIQVGYAVVNGVQRASYWEGSSGSWVDLGAFLPSEFAGSASTARNIWVDGNTVYIVGDAVNTLTGRKEAVMWVSVVGNVSTSIDRSVDGYGASLSGGESTLSRNLVLTVSGTATGADVEGFEYSLDGEPFKHSSLSVFLGGLSLGSHTIEVRAIDSNANVDLTPALFYWIVISPAEATLNLIQYIEAMSMPPSLRMQLLAPLNQAFAALNDGNPNNDGMARSLLLTFTTRVTNALNSGRLTPQQAQDLISRANTIIKALGP